MNLRDLEVFLAVARAGSLKAAAVRHPRTISALSKAVRRVESALEQELFDRRDSRLQLNAAGVHFVTHAQQMVALFAQAKAQVRRAHNRDTAPAPAAPGTARIPGRCNSARPGH